MLKKLEICKDRNKKHSVVPAYADGKRRDYMYVIHNTDYRHRSLGYTVLARYDFDERLLIYKLEVDTLPHCSHESIDSCYFAPSLVITTV